ncbi:sulfur carrier protein ThiS adenylyltransferase ThiF [Caloramator australicus]|uniref:Sulfur carrier protein adenylyltransferase ThiF n=1 Tax=Caloramator australicus RC3 TaxID=857293 RepID=I7KUA0_9CLOT|nr:sulfur carrier protein ThiS adenylyltransferase ThiF [Caloramator australicus]CCJ33453.1 Sulfur carrier protein adenylyltransferase ThiF [Caloramator australicus RC3]
MTFREILLNYLSEKELKKIEKTKVIVIGCGGLGSNVAKLLIRTGFLKLTLIDFDEVELKNLNRQDFYLEQVGNKKVYALKENLLKINKDALIETLCLKITEDNLNLLKQADIVVEAVDREEYKRMIFEYCLSAKIRVVCASGVAGFGDGEGIKIKRGKNYSIIGDFRKSIIEFSPLSPKVTAVASLQADEVLRMVIGDES